MRRVTDFVDPTVLDCPGRTRANFPEIIDPVFWSAYVTASPFSMVHITGFYNVFQSLAYLGRNRVPGHLVECGCFLGGMAIFIGHLRQHFGLADRRVVLFDTFSGFPEGAEEKTLHGTVKGEPIADLKADVEDNLRTCLGDLALIDLVQGPVEMTLPATPVDAISMLRLDTDFYPSTRAELDYLYPKLVRGGVLIVDDYGFFHGARRATDEFLAREPSPPLLNRIDATVWAGVKP